MGLPNCGDLNHFSSTATMVINAAVSATTCMIMTALPAPGGVDTRRRDHMFV